MLPLPDKTTNFVKFIHKTLRDCKEPLGSLRNQKKPYGNLSDPKEPLGASRTLRNPVGIRGTRTETLHHPIFDLLLLIYTRGKKDTAICLCMI